MNTAKNLGMGYNGAKLGLQVINCTKDSMAGLLTEFAREWSSKHSYVRLSDVASYVAAEDDMNEEHTDFAGLLLETASAFEWASESGMAFGVPAL